MSATLCTTEPEAGPDIEALARYFAESGQVVPGISVAESGRARSWWWPLPAARDRDALAALCANGSREAQHAAAEQIAVDRIVRDRLVERGVELTPRRPGRRSLEEAWLISLTAADPWMARSIDAERLRAFEREITCWVASGAATTGSIRLCLRVREPVGADTDDSWSVELLAQDVGEPSLIVPAVDVWRGRSPFGPHAIEELLASLGRLARLAPELAGVLDDSAPGEIGLSAAAPPHRPAGEGDQPRVGCRLGRRRRRRDGRVGVLPLRGRARRSTAHEGRSPGPGAGGRGEAGARAGTRRMGRGPPGRSRGDRRARGQTG